MLTYPLSRAEYLLGKVVVNVTVAVLQAIIALSLGKLVFGIHLQWRTLPLTLIGMAAGTAGWFFFYSIFALKTRRNDVFNAVTSIFYFVFLFASSMFYPLDPLPRWLRTAAAVNPITWQIDWLRWTSIGLGDARRATVEAIGFLLFAGCSFAYAAHALQQQE
jgi:ABC-2 type transport system permease protein